MRPAAAVVLFAETAAVAWTPQRGYVRDSGRVGLVYRPDMAAPLAAVVEDDGHSAGLFHKPNRLR